MKLVYPAIFYPEDNETYSVIIPDLNDLATQGNTLSEAIYMAKDACYLYIKTTLADGDPLPKPTEAALLKPETKTAKILPITIETK